MRWLYNQGKGGKVMEHTKDIAERLHIQVSQVENTLKLLEEGNTVPFIARYRKEMTHGLDEEQILYIQKEYEYQCNLQKRKEDVLRIIETLFYYNFTNLIL